jgi:hypothetical protein
MFAGGTLVGLVVAGAVGPAVLLSYHLGEPVAHRGEPVQARGRLVAFPSAPPLPALSSGNA